MDPLSLIITNAPAIERVATGLIDAIASLVENAGKSTEEARADAAVKLRILADALAGLEASEKADHDAAVVEAVKRASPVLASSAPHHALPIDE